MRNLKKLLAVVLTVVMIASMMVPALAANTYEAEALKLQSIGMFAGEPADLKLEEGVTRIQGLAFAIRAAGVEADAFAMTDEEVATILDTYVDGADVPEWGRKYAAYAIKNGITVGVSATEKKFAALDPISGTSFLVFLMKAGMGYADVTTATVVEASVEAGILTAGQAAQFGAKAALIRDDAAGILYGAAMNGVNADGTPLIEALIASGFVDRDAALEAGFVEEVVPEDLEVLDVSLINLQQAEIQFNMAMDKDSIKAIDNYTISGSNNVATVNTVKHAALSEDGMVVTLTFNNALDNQTGKVTITVKKDIKNADGDKLGANYYARDLKFTDTKLPELESINVIGNKKLEVFYSEPVSLAARTASNYKIDGKLFAVSNIDLDTTETSRKVTFTLANRLAAGEHTIELLANKVLDMAGLKNVGSELTFTVDDVTDAPNASIIAATTAKVTIQFDREITKAPSAKFGSTKVTTVQDADDKTIYYANFGTGVIPNAGGDLLILKTVEDFFGNKTTADIKLSFVPTFDNERPEVVSITSEKEGEMIIEFNEDIKSPATATITIKDADGDRVTGITVAFARTDAGKVINNKVKVTGNFKPADGPYTVNVKGIKDLQDNPMIEVEDYEVSIPDKTAPTVKSVVKNTTDNKIAVTFSEVVYNADDLANYKYEITSKGIYALPDGSSIELTGNGKSAIITFPSSWAIGNVDYTITNVSRLYISGVEDADGNVMDDVGVVPAGSEVLSTIKSVKATDVNTIKIEYNDDGKVLPSTLYAGDFVITGGGTYTVSNAELDGRTIVLTIEEDLPGNPSTLKVGTVLVDDIQETKTALGTKFAVASTTIADKIAPSVKVDDIVVAEDGNLTVKIPLTETLTAYSASAILVKNDGDTLVADTDYTAVHAAGEITITFKNTFDLTKDILVSIPDSSALLLNTDAAGNALKTMDVQTVKFDLSNALVDAGMVLSLSTPDAIESVKLAGNVFFVTDEYRDANKITVDGVDYIAIDIATVNVSATGKYHYTSYDGNNWLAVESEVGEARILAEIGDTNLIDLVVVSAGKIYVVSYQLIIVDEPTDFPAP